MSPERQQPHSEDSNAELAFVQQALAAADRSERSSRIIVGVLAILAVVDFDMKRSLASTGVRTKNALPDAILPRCQPMRLELARKKSLDFSPLGPLHFARVTASDPLFIIPRLPNPTANRDCRSCL
jgi:hypothetical protein